MSGPGNLGFPKEVTALVNPAPENFPPRTARRLACTTTICIPPWSGLSPSFHTLLRLHDLYLPHHPYHARGRVWL